MEHKVIKTLAATTLATGSILASVAIANNDMAKQTITYWASCTCYRIGTAFGKLGNYMSSKVLTQNEDEAN